MSTAFLMLRQALIRPTIIRDRKEGRALTSKLSLNFGLLLTLLLVSVLYLVQVNTLATKGYVIKSLQKHIVEQKHDAQALQMKSIEAGRFSLIQEKSALLNLVKTNSVDYLGSGATVAQSNTSGRP